MKPHEDTNPHSTDPAEKRLFGKVLCYVCETDVAERKSGKKDGEEGKEKIRPGLVEISSEGTGFAGAGPNMATRIGTAFQC